MPALVVFGFRTAVAGDDLRITLGLAIIFRVLQLTLACAIIPLLEDFRKDVQNGICVEASDKYEPKETVLAYFYVALSLFVSVVAVVLDLLMLRTSKQGTPTQPEKRSLLKPLCAIKVLPLSLIRIVTTVFGIMCAIVLSSYCSCIAQDNNSSKNTACTANEAVLLLMKALLATHILEDAVAACIYLYFVFQVSSKPSHGVLYRRRYQWTCQLLCTCTSVLTCCMFGGRHAISSDFLDVSQALEDLFDDGGYLDVTTSDIITGLILVYREQLHQRENQRKKTLELKESMSRDPVKDRESSSNEDRNSLRISEVRRDSGSRRYLEQVTRKILDAQHPVDRRCISDGAHFARLTVGVYGHMMYLLDHNLKAACYLSTKCITTCGKKQSGIVFGDNLLGCNKNAFLKVTGLDEDALLYASFRSTVRERPYCIVADDAMKAIVVVIRGTFSLEAAVADLTVSPVSLEQVGERFGFDGTGSYCHSGMLASAQWLCDDLEKQGILPKLLIGNNCSHPEFKLYLAGHSLGAGVAAILSLLLQSRYPDHKCLCYEPPGCVLSPSIANQENMISFVLGTDIVPRLSMEAMEHLRDDVLDMILRTKVPKHRVFAQTRFFPRDLSSVPSNVLLIHSKESIPACTFRDKLEEFKSYGEAKKAERGENSALVTPGRIIHLVKTGEEEAVRFSLRPASPTDHYTPVWANRDDFGEIQLSTTLIADHNPETVAVELQRIADSFSSQLELSQSNSRVNH